MLPILPLNKKGGGAVVRAEGIALGTVHDLGHDEVTDGFNCLTHYLTLQKRIRNSLRGLCRDT